MVEQFFCYILLTLNALISSPKPELEEGQQALRQGCARSIEPMADKGEAIAIVEPLIPEEASKYRAPLNVLAVELASQSSGLRSSLPEGIGASLIT